MKRMINFLLYLVTDPIHPHNIDRPNRVKSVLVKTGVYNPKSHFPPQEVNHLHRDTICRADLAVPTFVCEDVLHAVDTILEEEDVL